MQSTDIIHERIQSTVTNEAVFKGKMIIQSSIFPASHFIAPKSAIEIKSSK
jgi:hypothetical protein